MEAEGGLDALVEEAELDKCFFFVCVLVVGEIPDVRLDLLRAEFGVEGYELPRGVDPDGDFGAVDVERVRRLGDWQGVLVGVAQAVLAVEAGFFLALSELLALCTEMLLLGFDALDLVLAGGVLKVVGPLSKGDDGALVLVEGLLVETICNPERLFRFVLFVAWGRRCARVHGWRQRGWQHRSDGSRGRWRSAVGFKSL